MGFQATGDWQKAYRILDGLNRQIRQNTSLATKANGVALRDAMKKKILVEQPSEWPPLKPATIARKGSSKMLVNHADLVNSINDVTLGTMVFIGVPRTAKNQDGEELVNIAAVQVFGSEKQGIPPRDFMFTTAREMDLWMKQQMVDACKAALRLKPHRPKSRFDKAA